MDNITIIDVSLVVILQQLMIELLTCCRRGPVRYKFHTLYELDNLAVVNVKDTNVIKNAFKLLIFPDTRLFQIESPKAKVSSLLLWCIMLSVTRLFQTESPKAKVSSSLWCIM